MGVQLGESLSVRSDSPGSDADHGLRGDLQTLLRVDLSHVIHPGVCIFDVDDAPGEGASDHPIEPAADSDAGTVLRGFHGVVAPFRIVAKGSVAVIPLLQQLFLQGQIVDFLGHFSAAEHELGEWRETARSHGGPTETATVEERIGTVIVIRLMHDQAATHLRDDLQLGINAGRTAPSTTDTGTAAEKGFVVGESRQFDISSFGCV